MGTYQRNIKTLHVMGTLYLCNETFPATAFKKTVSDVITYLQKHR